jgi:pentapeptide repeat protein
MWLSLAIPVAAVIIYVLIWYGPDLIAKHDIGTVTGPLRIFRLQQARDAERGRLLTLGAGLFAAGALIFTGRNYKVARETLEVTERGQVTDRYTKAIEQLGSKGLDVRIGGIYALGRIARDSPTDHSAVMDVVSAFIREHSHEVWPPPKPNVESDRRTRPDVQAALTVIGCRDSGYDRGPIDLQNAILSGANLKHAILSGANLSDADLSSAFLDEADLSGAYFYGTVFTGAYLRQANLTDAILTGPDPNQADVTSAYLEAATLTDANLTRAKWPPSVRVPEGWKRDPDSGLLGRASMNADNSGN